jgi:hypothetical protein
MWQPSWSTANFIYELSQVLFLAGILMSGIAIVGMVWMAPLRNLAVNLETTRSPQTENFQAGKEQLARVIAERGSRPERLTDEQTNVLSANLGDAVQTMLIIRVNDTEAANIAKQLAAAFVKARIPARVGVMESEGAPSGLVLYDPDASRGAALSESFEQAGIAITWEKRLHPRFPSQPVLLVGRVTQAPQDRNVPAMADPRPN